MSNNMTDATQIQTVYAGLSTRLRNGRHMKHHEEVMESLAVLQRHLTPTPPPSSSTPLP